MSRTIPEIRSEIKNIFSNDGIGEAIKRLKALVHPDGRAYNFVLQLEQELREVNLKKVSGSIDERGLDLKYAELAERLLTLLDTLDDSDLEPSPKGKKSKQGSLLYQIPAAMAVQKETRCRVRIAYDLDSVLENIELTEDTHIKEVRISEVMQVELIDPAQEAAFFIRTFNSEEQFIEKDEYTEWIFFVKPLRQGSFPLLLRISVIEKIGDKERTRDIVLEEMVVIVAEMEAAPEPDFKQTGLKVGERTIAGGDPSTPSSTVEQQTAVRRRSPALKRTFSGALVLAVLMTVSGITFFRMNTKNFAVVVPIESANSIDPQLDSISKESELNLNIPDSLEDVLDGLSANMFFVKGGTFTMGCTSEQGSDCDNEEKPAHQVTVSDFYIGKYEVTQKEWREVMGSNPSYFKNCDNCPVEQVSWTDIQEFLSKLNAKTGKTYRLPTEAEWEYAARGGASSGGYKYAGSNTLNEVAWYADNFGSKTHPVGLKKANELGLYDMSGNVWELCADWYGAYSTGAQTNPKGLSVASRRVNRGGSWGSDARNCRISGRDNITPSNRANNLGFRLAL